MGTDLARVQSGQLGLDGVETTPTSLTLAQDVSFDRAMEIGELLVKIDGATRWWIGDWWTQVVDKWGEIAWAETGERDGARVPKVNLSYGRLLNLQNVCKSVPPSRRREELSFYHHDLVAKLAPDVQDVWLTKAADGDWSARELRRQMRVAGLKPADLDQPQWSGTPEEQLEQAERERKALIAERDRFEELLQEEQIAAGKLVVCPMCQLVQPREAAEAAARVVEE